MRHLRLPISVVLLLLAGLTAAFAATGSVPLVARGGDPATARALRAGGGLSISDSAGGQAILIAAGMAPGQTRVGEVTIGNDGDVSGVFSLAAAGVIDTGGALSAMLQLKVDDVTGAAATTVYSGRLDAMGAVSLGDIPAGESRSYRFSVTFPSGNAAVDNALQGASTSVQFDWSATAPEPPPATTATTPTTDSTPTGPAGPPPRALSLSLKAPPSKSFKKGLTLTIACSQDCTARITGTVRMKGVRKALKLTATSVSLGAGKARTVRLKLSKTLKSALARALAAGKQTTVTFRVTAKGSAGTAVTATRASTLKR
jgi:hypothetical protein